MRTKIVSSLLRVMIEENALASHGRAVIAVSLVMSARLLSSIELCSPLSAAWP